MTIESIIAKISEHQNKSRVLVAIAGPPTSGKSTISEKLMVHFRESAVVLPMDGFHLDDEVLLRKGTRSRKGAPETFDADGFLATIQRVESGAHVFVPKFDRSLELSKAAAIEIRDQKIVIVEGNYLFLDRDPWRELILYWHVSVWLNISLETVRQRSIERWLGYGFSQADAEVKADQNDVKNAEFVISNLAYISNQLII